MCRHQGHSNAAGCLTAVIPANAGIQLKNYSLNIIEKITIATLSDTGKRRSHNEDSILSDSNAGMVILADGLGGHNAGEVASAIAVAATHEQILQGLKGVETNHIDENTGLTAVSGVVKQAVTQANSDIYDKSQREIECLGMGTTIVVCVFHDNLVTAAHVGDSRLYRKREENFTQLTEDHFTWPWLDRALGVEENVVVDVMEEAVRPNDIYLLSSDGLTDMVDEGEIHSTISEYSADLAQTARELVRKANENGGKDNISVILVKVRE